MQKGNIGVTSQDIFPLIKKFMYNDQDIFIREIVSNAVDATQKLKSIISLGEYSANVDDLKVSVTIDKTLKTITVSDNGIGMTEEELDKYINQIAFSSANEFLEKYKDTNIIGHFGLGFYSSFMVSDKVEIITKSYKENSIACKWSCEGTTDYEISDIVKDTIGSDVIMYINDEYAEYLNSDKLKTLLTKYGKFLPVDINLIEKHEQIEDSSTHEITIPEDTVTKITSDNALWTKQPSTLTEEDYINFYKELYPDKPEPLFWIHINIDMPFTFTGILYFPTFDLSNPVFERHNLSLYCNRVFVTDNVEGILPEYLSLLHGIIDSPDIPLNVSRSFLQSDTNVKKISTHITNKVMSELKKLLNKDRETYEKKWDIIKLFINLGVVTQPDIFEKAKSIILLTDIDNKKYTFDEYFDAVKDNQTDKNGKVVYLYTYCKEDQDIYVEQVKELGYNILLINEQFASFEVQTYEHELKDKNVIFKRIDSYPISTLIEKENTDEKKELADNVKNMLISIFNAANRKIENIDYTFDVNSLGENSLPIMTIADEWRRRMKEMSSLNNSGMFLNSNNIVRFILNSDSPSISKVLTNADHMIGEKTHEINEKLKDFNLQIESLEKNEDLSDDDKKLKKDELKKNVDELVNSKEELIKQYVNDDPLVNELIDIALLQCGLLSGEDLTKFIKNVVTLLNK